MALPWRFRWWQVVGFLTLVAMFPTYSALCLVLMLPLLVAILADNSPRRELPLVMMPFLFAAMVHPCHAVWLGGSNWNSSIAEMTDPTVIFIDWAAGASGWFLSEISMIVARMIYVYGTNAERRNLERQRVALEEEWGLSVPAAAETPALRPNRNTAAAARSARAT